MQEERREGEELTGEGEEQRKGREWRRLDKIKGKEKKRG